MQSTYRIEVIVLTVPIDPIIPAVVALEALRLEGLQAIPVEVLEGVADIPLAHPRAQRKVQHRGSISLSLHL